MSLNQSTEWGSGLQPDSFRDFLENLNELLEYLEPPRISEVLFAEGPVVSPILKKIPRISLKVSRIPRSLFKNSQEFEPRFRQILEAGYHWLDVEVHGVLDEKLLLIFHYPDNPCGAKPEECRVSYVSCTHPKKWKPRWRFC